MAPRVAILLACLLGAAGVAAGAIGSHVFEKSLSARQFEQYQIAVRYQIFHALLLLAIGTLLRGSANSWLTAGSWLALLGTLLFCGCLYGYIAADAWAPRLKWLVHLVPVGGTMLIAAWLAVAMSAVRE